MLVALLCVLTTALFALADASASRAGASGRVPPRAERMVSSENGRGAPVAVLSGRAVADADNPFEHGRPSLAGTELPMPRLLSGKPAVTADAGPRGVESPLPERPPRV